MRLKTVATMGIRTGRKNRIEEMKFVIVNMVRTGMSHTNVGFHFSISRSAASKMMKRSEDKENCIMKKGGAKFKLSEAAFRILQRIILKNNKKSRFVLLTSSESTMVTNRLPKPYANTYTNVDYVTMRRYQNHT